MLGACAVWTMTYLDAKRQIAKDVVRELALLELKRDAARGDLLELRLALALLVDEVRLL